MLSGLPASTVNSFTFEKSKHSFSSSGYTYEITVSREGFGDSIKKGNVTKPSVTSVATSGRPEPVTPKPEPTHVPNQKPVEKPSIPEYACPVGMDPNKPCDVIMDTNFYYSTYSSQSEADNAGQYFLDDVVTIGDKEITNYSVQPVYRNDGSVAYYGLNLWSYGSLIQ